MQGRGVTNFLADKPSHGFTASTTEFDDALIQRGIVTTEQALMAKGASMEEAVRLAKEKRRGFGSIIKTNGENANTWNKSSYDNDEANSGEDDCDISDNDSFEDDFDDDDDDDDDNAFLQQYRQQRLDQIKLEQEAKKAGELSHSRPSAIIHIDRDDWREEVNEASMDRWVVITMTESSGDRRDRVVQELHRFAREFYPSTSCVQERDSDSDDDDSLGGHRLPQDPARNSQPRLLTISASDAIPNWPAERVPAMFAYRDGVKQHEWVAGRRGEFPSRDILERLFRKWNAI